MADLYDKIKDSQGLLGKIAGMIPGFSGYMARETRREADKMLRETVANRYSEQLNRISDLQVQLVTGGGIDWVDDLQDAATRLQRFIDTVRTAAYGYGGLFTAAEGAKGDLAELFSLGPGSVAKTSQAAAAAGNVAGPAVAGRPSTGAPSP